MINRVVLVGRITRDPELRTTQGGKSVVDFSIAVDKRVKPKDGPTADFFRVQAWDKAAEFVANYLGKGRLVAVDGRLTSRKYTATDGANREVVEVVAETVQSLDRPKDDDPGNFRTGTTTNGGGTSTSSPSLEDEFDPFADE